MPTHAGKPTSIDAYIAGFPADVQRILKEVRRTIRAAAPGAGEAISYGMPALMLDGRFFVAFAGWKKHISMYPVPSGSAALNRQLAEYQAGKGTLRFPLDRPMPYGLMSRAVKALLKARAARPKAETKT